VKFKPYILSLDGFIAFDSLQSEKVTNNRIVILVVATCNYLGCCSRCGLLKHRKSEQAQSSWGTRSKDLQIFIDHTFRAGIPNVLFPMHPLVIPTHEQVPLQHFDK